VIAKRSKAVGVALRYTPSGEAGGSRFIVDASGTIITNLHLVRGVTAAAVKLSKGDSLHASGAL
jgi:S1-C subfamily serine protease